MTWWKQKVRIDSVRSGERESEIVPQWQTFNPHTSSVTSQLDISNMASSAVVIYLMSQEQSRDCHNTINQVLNDLWAINQASKWKKNTALLPMLTVLKRLTSAIPAPTLPVSTDIGGAASTAVTSLLDSS